MIQHQISNSIGNYNYNAYTYTDRIWPLHFHGNYELIYTIEGETEVTVNGISDVLSKNHFLLISPYSPHSLNISKESKTWVAVFSKDYVADFSVRYAFTNFCEFTCCKSTEDFLMMNLLQNPKPEHYLLKACLYLACSECVANGTISNKNNTNFIKDVTIYVTQNIEDNVTMKETADALNYEYHYFSALFNKHFSMNFKKFINTLRFELACQMFAKENTSITEICSKCGFKSIRNFNRIFKEFSGMTPNEYKRNVYL